MTTLEDRIARLEALVECQAVTIEQQQRTIEQQQRTIEQQQRTIERQERRRIQDPWLLLLRAAALAMLAIAFARPYLRAESPTKPPVIVAVDVSYSMGAPGRLDAARTAAARVLDGLDGDTPAGLVSFADRATVVAEPTTDHGAVRAQLGGLQASSGATRYAGALEAARGLLDGRPGRVVLISDLQARGWARGTTSLPDNIELDVVGVGARVDNVLVRDLVVTPEQARVVVSNAGQGPAALAVTFGRVEGQTASQALTLDGGVSRELVFKGPLTGGAYVAKVTNDGGLPADDERFAVLRNQAATTVRVLVGDEVERSRALFVERAFAALGTDPTSSYAVQLGAVGDVHRSARADHRDLRQRQLAVRASTRPWARGARHEAPCAGLLLHVPREVASVECVRRSGQSRVDGRRAGTVRLLGMERLG